MSREILEAVRQIEREKGIEDDILVRALEDALLAAYKKTPGAARHATVELDSGGDFRVWSVALPADVEERLIEEARERAITELEAAEIENGERSHTLVTDDDLVIDWSDVPDEQVKRADVTPENFGRIAAQTAKQVILQRIREAEREMMYDEYVDRVTEVVTGIVQQAGDRNNVLVDLGKVEALLPRSEQVDGERYEQGSRIKAVITEVRSGTKGPQVILSRRDPELIKTLFELEVPEIADGLVEIRGVAREPGYRSRASTRSARVWAREGPASAWWSLSSAARRSTSSRGIRSPLASSPRRSRPRAFARCSSTTIPARRPWSSPMTSSRSPSARRA
jgi:N utilization substance protein A